MAFLHISAFDYTQGWGGIFANYTIGFVLQTTSSTHLNTHSAESPLTFELTLL